MLIVAWSPPPPPGGQSLVHINQRLSHKPAVTDINVSVLCCRMHPEAPCSQLRSRRLPREVLHHSRAICRPAAATGKLSGQNSAMCTCRMKGVRVLVSVPSCSRCAVCVLWCADSVLNDSNMVSGRNLLPGQYIFVEFHRSCHYLKGRLLSCAQKCKYYFRNTVSSLWWGLQVKWGTHCKKKAA
jgi:Pyruvate/2-oxoacid:ferredoxin oxidoreductase delta subunit